MKYHHNEKVGAKIKVRKKEYLNEFKSLGKLGEGGFGTVEKVQNTTTLQVFAMKKIPLSKESQVFSVQEITVSELLISQKDSENYFMYYHEIFSIDKNLFILYDVAYLGSLHSYIEKNGPFEWKKLLPKILHLAKAIRFIHRNRIHCDIKPGNVLLTDDDMFRLSDFGLSCFIIIPHTTSVGTQGFSK